jgi:hypothetical protein
LYVIFKQKKYFAPYLAKLRRIKQAENEWFGTLDRYGITAPDGRLTPTA